MAKSPQKPWLPPAHRYVLRVCFGHQHLGTQSSCRHRMGSSSPSWEVKVTPQCLSMGLSRAHQHQAWGPTSP